MNFNSHIFLPVYWAPVNLNGCIHCVMLRYNTLVSGLSVISHVLT